jgi:hypothetical protein
MLQTGAKKMKIHSFLSKTLAPGVGTRYSSVLYTQSDGLKVFQSIPAFAAVDIRVPDELSRVLQ